jgi:hypothetical protein
VFNRVEQTNELRASWHIKKKQPELDMHSQSQESRLNSQIQGWPPPKWMNLESFKLHSGYMPPRTQHEPKNLSMPEKKIVCSSFFKEK